jgi:glycosyltransferase involved in cell wall biosynthesis
VPKTSSSPARQRPRFTPLVSVLTPVFNGARYLAECIESVRNQRYDNWEYIIVNNCSTDATLEIALRHAAEDPRIRVVTNRSFVGMFENHNIAMSLISPESAYCKVVPADDWITPDCLERLVRLAEAHPGVGIVGSYQFRDQVRWMGLPTTTEVISGRELCRSSLLGELDVFGSTTSCLYRSALVHAQRAFFPHSRPHADTTVCYRDLQHWDFGFVHAVLSIERVHDDRATAKAERLNMGTIAYLETVLEYGPIYLTRPEFERRKCEVMGEYYRFLGGCLLKMRTKEFWTFHSTRSKELGHPIPWRKVIQGAAAETIEEMRNPRTALRKLAQTVRHVGRS